MRVARIGALRHGTAELLGDRGGVVDVVLEPRCGHAGGDRGGAGSLEPSAAILEEQAELVGEPGADAGAARPLGGGPHGVGCGVHRRAPRAERIERPELASDRRRRAGSRPRPGAAGNAAGSRMPAMRELAEERARLAGRLLRRPPGPAEQEIAAGAGERDVGESALLVGVPFAVLVGERPHRLVELDLALRAAPLQFGQLVAVALEVVGQLAEREPALRRARLRRQFLVDEPGDGDDVPLESLRPVDREHLHGAGLGFVLAGREPVALLRLGEPPEERPERRVLRDVGEAGEQFVERLEARRAERLRRVRRDLDVEEELLLDEVHEVDEAEPRTPPERLELCSGATHAPEADLAERAQRRVPVGRGEEEVERVDDRRRLVGRDRGAQSLSHVVVEASAAEVAFGEPSREAVERGQVGRADAPPCAAEHAHELGAGRRVVQHAQHAHEVGDHRLVEQSGEAEHVRGHAVLAQGRREHADVREGAAQERAAGRRARARRAPSRAANQRATRSASSSMVSAHAASTCAGYPRTARARAAPSGCPRRAAR